MTATKVARSAKTTPRCRHLFGRSSDRAKAAIWQFAAPNPTIVIPAVTAPADFAVAMTRWPTKQMRLPPTRNQRRPRRSVLAPLFNISLEFRGDRETYAIVKQTVMASDQLGINQMYSVGVPKDAATSDWMAAKTGMGQKERPYPSDRIFAM